MKLYQMKTEILGQERLAGFLEDHYVSPGYPGLGGLEQADAAELRARLGRAGYEGDALEEAAESLELFVHAMQDGDYVLVADQQWAYLGDLGDYFYEEASDSGSDGRCHRRGVTWLRSVPLASLDRRLQALLREPQAVSAYAGTLPAARPELWIAAAPDEAGGDEPAAAAERKRSGASAPLDEATIAAAVQVLKDALASPDPDRRERAAIALLQYARPY